MTFIDWLITEGLDKYMLGIFAKNFLTIGFAFALAKTIAKMTPGKEDDEAISALEQALSIFKRKGGGSGGNPQ